MHTTKAPATRFEQKFLLPAPMACRAGVLLDHAFVKDQRYPTNTVCSLYFDTPDLESYGEVVDGDSHKEKLRIRWYEPADSGAGGEALEAYVELKRKMGFVGEKRRMQIRLERSDLDGAFEHPAGLCERVVEAALSLGWVQRRMVQPVIVIKYERERYWDPISGLRIALDRHVRVTAVNQRILRYSARAVLDEGILELKGTRCVWPRALDALGCVHLRSTSFSKYAHFVGACLGEVSSRARVVAHRLILTVTAGE